jgi:general nucleoside transport system ATP-binding protein
VLSFPLLENLVLCNYYRPPFRKGLELDRREIEQFGSNLIREFDVRTPSAYTLAGNLSGGNQQKVIVAREFSRNSKLILAAQPTRGLDVGSTEFIHRRLIEERDRGAAVLLVSVELDEILSLADRIAVLYKGRIIDILDSGQASAEQVGLLMAGVTREEQP